MSSRSSRSPRGLFAALLFIFALGLALPLGSSARAAVPVSVLDPAAMFKQVETSVAPACACEASQEDVDRFIGQLEGQASVEEAQALALEQSRLARRAIELAGKVGPLRDSLAPTDARLSAYEAAVGLAQTPSEVASAFKELLSRDGDRLQDVKRSKQCDYTVGEVVIIIIGFILGIIPGIIFLFLLC